MRRRGHCALPSRRRRSPSSTPDRGHEVAESRGRRKVSVAPGRRSGPSRRRGRAGAHSGGLRASACAAVLWQQGSPRPPGRPSPANRRPRHPQLRPPGRDRAEAGRGGAGAHLFGQSTPLQTTSPRPHCQTEQGDPLCSRHRPPISRLDPIGRLRGQKETKPSRSWWRDGDFFKLKTLPISHKMPTLPTGVQHWEEPPSNAIWSPAPTESGTLPGLRSYFPERRKSENPVSD
ncbi:uncharacterized protein LOC116570964 isoform X1 [Mustela erminea]|uniref:uncharacterized protein LOC116570964 isoform X1 n=1 Tax=Mustela erminea TaxID=36723 RepID=UPI001386B6D4|nr:uncharacterized protein LOC116570964 isoform X1 [Mustela erminea]